MPDMIEKEKRIMVPIWEKVTLTIEETIAYSNIGENKLRDLVNNPACNFVIKVGNRKLIKRKEFEKYISSKTYL